MSIILPLLVAIVAAVLYLFTAHTKGSELARLTYGAAVLVLLFVLASSSVRLLLEK